MSDRRGAAAAPPKKKKTALKVGVAGCQSVGAIAGSMEILVTYPMEYAKTHLQLEHGAARRTAGYTSTLGCLASTLRARGLPGIYQGATSWFVFAGPRSAVRFATFEACKDRGLFLKSDFLCGLFAGSMEAALCQTARRLGDQPDHLFSQANQSIQIKLMHDASPAVAVKLYSHLPFGRACVAIARHHGPLAFFDGIGPAVLKGAVTNAVRFFGYHLILDKVLATKDPSSMQSLLAGGTAAPEAAWEKTLGAVSAVVSQPIDTVKANMMGLDQAAYRSSLDCASQIVRADGPLALWKGVAPRTARVFVEVGLQFALFQHFSRLLDDIWPS